MPETKNVLELMTEMLHEQENYENSAIKDSYKSNSENGDKLESMSSFVSETKVNFFFFLHSNVLK